MGKRNQNTKRGGKFDLILQGNENTYMKEKVIVSFKPIKKHQILPVFNKDKKPYTPAFYVPALYNAADDLHREN